MSRTVNAENQLFYRAKPSQAGGFWSDGLHWLALLTVAATFPLICMGGLVTSHHAGMSVPDWPNSYGYNMFLFPPSKWVGGILYEHTHRLMGTVVGFLAIVMVAWAWIGWVQNAVSRANFLLTLIVLAAVIFQGVLGGLRVIWVQLDLAIVHACVAQAFFCLAAYTALVTSRWWQNAPASTVSKRTAGIVTLGWVTVVAIYLQLIVGAAMRHFDAGLAIPDLPLAYGKWLAPTSAEDLAAINHLRAFQLNLDPVTLPQVWLHFGHRMGAVIVSALVVTLALRTLFSRPKKLVFPAAALLLLLAGQVTLGTLTVLLHKPADVASAHVAVGALVLMTAFVLTACQARLHWAAIGKRIESPLEPATLPNDISGIQAMV